ncbi:MAG: hypothetical protein JXR65_00455 [Bacteroidales bacterium]|nr:hypothetical protein [Bacteroidales bacterium]
MKNAKLKLTFHVTLFTFFVAAISVLVQIFVPQLAITPVYPFVLIFFFLATWLILMVLEKSFRSKLSRFANAYMLVNFIKLILFSAVIAVYAISNKTDAVSFVITFFVYYIFYTLFEVIELRKLNSQ